MGNDCAPYRGLKSEATAPSQSPGLTIESRFFLRDRSKKGVDFFTVTLSMSHVEHSDHVYTKYTKNKYEIYVQAYG
jgi:hypothetical protein